MEFSSFEECWNAICKKLSPRPRLYCWSAAGRAHGSFAVTQTGQEGTGQEGITVRTDKGPRFVPRRDFESLFPYWPEYKDGKIQRHKLNFNVNTTYVLSVLHWLELQ